MECSLRGRKTINRCCETFLFVIFAPLLIHAFFQISTKSTINSHQNRTEPKKRKTKSLKGVYIHNSFSPSPKNAPTNPSLPPPLIKNRKVIIPHPTNHVPKKRKQKKKRKRKNSQPQLRLLIPPHIGLLSTPLTHLQTPPFALHDPCAETVMIGVVAGEMTMFDETAT